MNIVKTKLSVH